LTAFELLTVTFLSGSTIVPPLVAVNPFQGVAGDAFTDLALKDEAVKILPAARSPSCIFLAIAASTSHVLGDAS
jgi:hypothetical protein